MSSRSGKNRRIFAAEAEALRDLIDNARRKRTMRHGGHLDG